MPRKLAVASVVAALAAAPFLARVTVAAETSADKSDTAAASAKAAEAGADALYKQIEDAKPAKPDEAKLKDDVEYRKAFIKHRQEIAKTRAELAAQFLEKYPDDSRKVDVLHARVIGLFQAGVRDEQFVDAVKAFAKAAPKDERGAGLLYYASRMETDPDKRKALVTQVVENYPDSRSGKLSKGELARTEKIGKPFELEFTDAISGKRVAMTDLKGKVVVVDFWATWCPQCIEKMPTLKALYAQWKAKGVEFIGVSLDAPESEDGGLTKMKEFVAKNELAWPQYYQGHGWESEFSTSWGIGSLPSVFVVDADGNLFSTDPEVKLETLIPELLAKAGKKAS